MDTSDDSLVRMPSSGCSSLLEYVHNMPSGHGASSSSGGAGGSPSATHHHSGHHGSAGCGGGSGNVQQLRRITEEQLQSIAGPEAAPVLAAALGVVLEGSGEGTPRTSRADSARGPSRRSSMHNNGSATGSPGVINRTRRCGSLGDVLEVFGVSRAGGSGDKPVGHVCDADAVCRQLSGVAVSDSSGSGGAIPLSRSSSAALMLGSLGSGSSSPCITWRRQQQQLVTDSSSTAVQSSSLQPCRCSTSSSSSRSVQQTLRLQHTRLPPGCCKSIGAVLYLSPHLSRLALVDVGLDDPAVLDLVDALRVNSSILLLDLSCNAVEDIGARALGKLLRQRSSCSSRLRVLCLQHNAIGTCGVQQPAWVGSGVLSATGSTVACLM